MLWIVPSGSPFVLVAFGFGLIEFDGLAILVGWLIGAFSIGVSGVEDTVRYIHTQEEHHQKKGFFAWFDRSFDKVTKKYELMLLKIIKHTVPMMVIFLVITGITFAGMKYWPTAFMPEAHLSLED